MNMENIPTPEVYNEIEENRGSIPKYGWVSPEKAQDLERRLTVAREALKLGIELQRPGDIWSVDPCKMQGFLRATTEALTQTAPKQ